MCVHVSSTAPGKPDETDGSVDAGGEGLSTPPTPSVEVSNFTGHTRLSNELLFFKRIDSGPMKILIISHKESGAGLFLST